MICERKRRLLFTKVVGIFGAGAPVAQSKSIAENAEVFLGRPSARKCIVV
jgi:hypothetical protein